MGLGIRAAEAVVPLGLHLAGRELRHGPFAQPRLTVLLHPQGRQPVLPCRRGQVAEIDHHATAADLEIGDQLLLHGLRRTGFETELRGIRAPDQRRGIRNPVGHQHRNLLPVIQYGAEHHRPVEIGPQGRIARDSLRTQGPSQREPDLVSVAPSAVDGKVSGRRRLHPHGPAIDCDLMACSPRRASQVQHEALGGLSRDPETDLVGAGKFGLLLQPDPPRLPVESRRDIQIHEEVVVTSEK